MLENKGFAVCSNGGQMDNGTTIRQELSELIRNNIDEIALRLERKYVEEYPHSRANEMDAALIHGWTLTDTENLCKAIEFDDMETQGFNDYHGDLVYDPEEREFTDFINFLGKTHFMARHIAPIIFRLNISNPDKSRELLECLERATQKIITYNLDLYAAEIAAPRFFIRKWDVLSGMDLEVSPDDTPLKRHGTNAVVDEANNEESISAINEQSTQKLSKRETEVVNLLLGGKTNSEIAAALKVSHNTIKNHVAHIFDKFNVNSRAELIVKIMDGKSKA